MHPDYLGYVDEKRKIHPQAKFYDVKALCGKLLACEQRSVYVKHVNYSDWVGWLIEFDDDVDLGELQRRVQSVIILSNRACFIGVTYG